MHLPTLTEAGIVTKSCDTETKRDTCKHLLIDLDIRMPRLSTQIKCFCRKFLTSIL